MNRLLIKIIITAVAMVAVAFLFAFGDRLPEKDDIDEAGGVESEYKDAFVFDPEELRYDGTGNLDLLAGVSLEGYTAQDLKSMVFNRIYAGDTLSQKIIQYTAETDDGMVRSTRALKLYNYTGPSIRIPENIPEVTRQTADHFDSLLAAKSGYAVDDGFGNDVHEHAVIRCEQDAKKSAVLHYTISYDNMFGDGDVEKVDVTLSGVPAYLTLTDSEITLRRDDAFDPAAYVSEAIYADGQDAFGDILYSGNVNTSEAGKYEVMYDLEGEVLTLYVTVG